MIDIPQWLLYFAGLAYAIWHRAVRQEGFGAGRSAGGLDLWCAMYLPLCNIFITDDAPQRRALRLLNQLMRNPRIVNKKSSSVVSYDEFCRRLFLPETGS
jgi:hypothetical protein